MKLSNLFVVIVLMSVLPSLFAIPRSRPYGRRTKVVEKEVIVHDPCDKCENPVELLPTAQVGEFKISVRSDWYDGQCSFKTETGHIVKLRFLKNDKSITEMQVWDSKGIVYNSYGNNSGRRSYCRSIEMDIEKWQMFLREKVPIFILQ